MSGKVGIDIRKELASWTRTDVIPFDAKHRFMATLNHDHENHAFVSVKGAPEQIFAMCDRQRTVTDSTKALTNDTGMKRPRKSPHRANVCWPLP